MTVKYHHYGVNILWTGNTGAGTKSYRSYDRSHTIFVKGKTAIQVSSDPDFLGDASKFNPEEMFLSSLSSCHMLWYLHLCAEEGITVTKYEDHAEGIMTDDAGGGRFKEVTLHPQVTITESSKKERANQLHKAANSKCFIANSCNFTIHHQPVCFAPEET